MTVDLLGSAGASPGRGTTWESLTWESLRASVKRLQMRIAKAIRENQNSDSWVARIEGGFRKA